MTSANVTHFTIFDKNHKLVASYRQSHLCKDTITDNLNKHTPAEDFYLLIEWPDEEEEMQVIFNGSLYDWIHKTKRH